MPEIMSRFIKNREEQKMKAYKGFDKELKCRDFQYEIGKEYEETTADLCSCGFHACENPLDVFNYYAPASSRYCEVEMDEVSPEFSNDSKRCSKKIRIGVEIGIKGIVEAGVKFIMDKIDWANAKEINTGRWSAATNTREQSVATNAGEQSAATNTGHWSVATNTGHRSAATNTGHWSAATNTGEQSVATNTGDWSVATNTGRRSVATNTGRWSAATNTGHRSVATNTGDQSVAVVEGKESIAIATGVESRAKGSLGCYIVLAEWYQDEAHDWHIKQVESAKIDGEKIKADTFYTLKNGEFVEVD